MTISDWKRHLSTCNRTQHPMLRVFRWYSVREGFSGVHRYKPKFTAISKPDRAGFSGASGLRMQRYLSEGGPGRRSFDDLVETCWARPQVYANGRTSALSMHSSHSSHRSSTGGGYYSSPPASTCDGSIGDLRRASVFASGLINRGKGSLNCLRRCRKYGQVRRRRPTGSDGAAGYTATIPGKWAVCRRRRNAAIEIPDRRRG